jgi:hypothetical protein
MPAGLRCAIQLNLRAVTSLGRIRKSLRHLLTGYRRDTQSVGLDTNLETGLDSTLHRAMDMDGQAFCHAVVRWPSSSAVRQLQRVFPNIVAPFGVSFGQRTMVIVGAVK